MKKIPFFLSFFCLFSLTLAACGGTATPNTAPTAEPATAAESASGSGPVTAEGKLLPAPAVELAFAQGGVVAEVLAKPGDQVAAGDVLARLVGVKTVEAQIAVAQTQYDQIHAAALAQEQSKRTQDWYKTQSGDFTLPLWYYDQDEQLRAAQVAVDEAQAELAKAREKLADRVQSTGGAEFIQAETALSDAQAAFQVAKNLNDRIKNGRNIDEMTRRQLYLLQRDAYLKSKEVAPKWVLGNLIDKDLRDEAQKIFEDADETLEDAQEAYDDALTSDGAKDILEARAQFSIAEERYYTAQDYLRALQTGSASQEVTAAQNAIDQAKAALDLYELRAPLAGTLLSFDLFVGETAAPAKPVAFLADTATWTVETKDLAEIDIARVALGQSVIVKLDALPDEEFPGTVTALDPVGKEYLGDMTYKVTVTLDKVDPRFLWNMTATVDIAVE